MNEYLFSYGTLQRDDVQLDLFRRQLSGAKEILKGYKIAEIEITDNAFLAKGEPKHQRTLVRTNADEDLIEGTVLEISSDELILADRYEPDGYERVKVRLESGNQAWVYIAG